MPNPKYLALPGFRRMALCLVLPAALALIACADSIAGSDPAPDESGTAQVSREEPAGKPGVPRGCTLEWSVAARDSVLNCPDVPPPSPK